MVNEKGNWCNHQGEAGTIISTAFNNFVMPLIRYKTNDLAEYSDYKCTCNRNYPSIAKILGRDHEYIFGSKGNTISLTALIFGQHFKAFANIRQMQIIQNEPGKIIVNIVREEGFSKNDICEIAEKISNTSANTISPDIQVVNHIPVTKNGKHKFLIQNISKRDDYEENY